MSMQTYIIYGYGFDVHVADKVLVDFIKSRENIVRSLNRGPEILDWIAKKDKENGVYDAITEDFFDYENEINGDEGLYGIISDIMAKETGIMFEYRRGSEYDDDMIAFPECYPWQLNDKERSLTQEEATEILSKYMKELQIAGEPNYVQVEYLG